MKKLHKTGEVAEDHAEKFCKQFNLPYSRATPLMQKKGVDFSYHDGKQYLKVDVKNTFDLYLLNINKSNYTLRLRHPFRNDNEIDEIWVQDKFTGKWKYQGPFMAYILDYFTSKDSYQRFYNYLQTLDNKRLTKDIAFSEMKFIKEKLKAFVKSDIYITYDDDETQLTMKMMTYANKNYVKKMEQRKRDGIKTFYENYD